jgi:ribosomal protein L37AE/L43A
MTSHRCPICDDRNADRQVIGPRTYIFRCSRCGEFAAANGLGWEKVETAGHQVRLSGWIREQNAISGKPPMIR